MSGSSASFGGGKPYEQGKVAIKVNPDKALIASIKRVDPKGIELPIYGYQDNESVFDIAVGDVLFVYRGKDKRENAYGFDPYTRRGPTGKQRQARVIASLNGLGRKIMADNKDPDGKSKGVVTADMDAKLSKDIVPLGICKTEWKNGSPDNTPLVCDIAGSDDFRAYEDFVVGDRVRFKPMPWEMFIDPNRTPQKGHEHFKAPLIVTRVDNKSFKTEFTKFLLHKTDQLGKKNDDGTDKVYDDDDTEKGAAWNTMFQGMVRLLGVAFMIGYDNSARDKDALAGVWGLSTDDRQSNNADGLKSVLNQIFLQNNAEAGSMIFTADDGLMTVPRERTNLAGQNAWQVFGPSMFEAFKEFTYGNGTGMAVSSIQGNKNGQERYVRVHYSFA